jgi:PAS domain S-box-containing protein
MTPSIGPTVTGTGQPVVFVGDEPPMGELAVEFEIVTVRERTRAVDRVETAAVSCVVVDGREDDRLETVAAVREAAPSVPILYVTATPDGTAAAAATRAGATEYFAGATDETLVDRVATLLVDNTDAHRAATGSIRAGPGARAPLAERDGSREPVSVGDHRADVVTQLLETTRALFSCELREDVAEVVVDAAERVLGFDVVSVRLYECDADDLVLTAASDAVGDLFSERKRVGVSESEMGDSFRRSEPVIFEDLQNSSQYDYGPLRGAMTIPIADHGLLNVGSPVSGAFDDHHVQLAQLLTASAAAALERADRREDLLRHERVLETVEGMVYATDGDSRLTLVTDPLAERLGYDRDDLLGEHVSLIFDEQAYDRAVRHVEELLADPQRDSGPLEATYTTADGEQFPVEIECSLLPGVDASFRGTVSVVRDITQRKEREQYLQVLNRVLRHNLRNDLTVVIGYAELLSERLDDDDLVVAADRLRETATGLARTSEKTRTIQYALDRDGDLEPIDVAEIVDDAVDAFDAADATLSVSTADSCRAWADPGLQAVVDNLLENAVHHTESEPTVEVSVTRDGEAVHLSVADDGPGIPPAEIDVVTGETDITQLTHSSGLGLWLVRWMIDSYGGDISFAESAIDGSRVEITLEAAPAEPSDAMRSGGQPSS